MRPIVKTDVTTMKQSKRGGRKREDVIKKNELFDT